MKTCKNAGITAPLSLALGFGEVTIARYLEGQIPSKQYSNIMRLALTLPAYMKKLLKKIKAGLLVLHIIRR